MDIISNVPVEIGLHILNFLPYKDLLACFKISREWRDIANCNYLWKKHCVPYATDEEITKAASKVIRTRLNFNVVSRYSLRSHEATRNNLSNWCGCAVLFKQKFGRHLKNWKYGHYVLCELNTGAGEFGLDLQVDDIDVVCSRDSLTICFYQLSLIRIVEMTKDGIKNDVYIDIPLPRWGRIESAQLTSEHLAVSCRSMVLLFKKNKESYNVHQAFTLHNSQLLSLRNVGSFQYPVHLRDRTISVALMSGNYTWFMSLTYLFVVHVDRGPLCRIRFESASVKHDDNNRVVVWSKRQIKIFTIAGTLLYSRKMSTTVKRIVFQDAFILLCRIKKVPKAYVEWWDPKTSCRKILKKVESETSMVICGEIVFLLEVKRHCFNRVSAINSKTGDTKWVYTMSAVGSWMPPRFLDKCIFEGICEKYLFVHVPCLNKRRFHIIEMNSGAVLYSKEFEPGTETYLFNEKLVVIIKLGSIRVLNYL